MSHRWSAGLVLMVSACAAPEVEMEEARSTDDPVPVPVVAAHREVPPPDLLSEVAVLEETVTETVEVAADFADYVEVAVEADVQTDEVHGTPPVEPGPAIEHWFQSELTDPTVTVFTFEEARRGHFGYAGSADDARRVRFGWVVPTWVQEGLHNPTLYHCWFRDAELIAVVDPTRMPSTVEVAGR